MLHYVDNVFNGDLTLRKLHRRGAHTLMKVDMLYEMIVERAADNREQQRRQKWREYNAATTIKVPSEVVFLLVALTGGGSKPHRHPLP